MFGTVAELEVLPGHEQQVMSLLEEWNRERRPKVDGVVAGYVYRSEKDPNEWYLAIVFRDRESYFANARDPEQDRWYQRLREHLEGDPEWHDGQVVAGP